MKRSAILFSLLVLFLLFNTLKIEVIDQSISEARLAFSIQSLAWLKLSLYFLFNILFFSIVLYPRRKFLFLALYLFQSTYLFTHLAYFFYHSAPFSYKLFILNFFEGFSLAQHLAIPLHKTYFLLLIDLPIFLLMLVFYANMHEILIKYKRYIIAIWISIVVLSVLGWGFLYNDKKVTDIQNDRYSSEIKLVNLIGIIGSDILDSFSFKGEQSLIRRLDFGPPLVIDGSHNGIKNIICIQVESLSANIIKYMYKGKYIMPFLSRLSSECIYYPYMLYYYFYGCTSDIEFTALNSAFPLTNFPVLKLRHYNYPNSIVRILDRENFETLAFHNNIGEFFNRKTAFLKMGFKEFYDMRKMSLKEEGWGASDGKVMEYIKGQLLAQKRPFFYYIITMSSHEPHSFVRAYYNNKDYDNISESAVKNYFNSLSYVDGILEEFVTFVRQHAKDTYIFIYGDHSVIPINRFLFSCKNSIPLFIITPEGQQYTESSKVISMLDIAPTILYAAGIKCEFRSNGSNLLNFPIKEEFMPTRNNYFFSRRGLFKKFSNKEATDYFLRVVKNIQLPEFISHGGGLINGISQTNSLEAFNKSYHNGISFMEVDLEWTTDGYLVLLHDWQESIKKLFGLEPRQYSLGEFNNLKMINGLTQLSWERFARWLRNHPGVFVVTDIKSENLRALEYLSKQYGDVKNQIIPQIYSIREYLPVRNLGFAGVILTLYRQIDTNEQILAFLKDNRIMAVTIPVEKALTGFALTLNRMGVPVYAHTVNSTEIENILKRKGIFGVYTDTLSPRYH